MPMTIENLNQNKCLTLRVEQGRNGRVSVNKHRLYGSLKSMDNIKLIVDAVQKGL